MYFGNSRVTIRKSANCDFYGITDKTFVVSFINGWVKDDVFLAYSPSCVGFDGLEAIAKLNYVCLENLFCSGLSSDVDPINQPAECSEATNTLDSLGVYTLENTFQYGPTGSGTIGKNNPFCTLEANWHNNDCSCPNGYVKSSEYYGDTCFRIFPIESIGLTFTDEIDPCRFFFLAKQVADIAIDFQNTVANIYYKTYDEGGVEICNVASFQVSPDPCSDTYINCWPPPGPDLPLIPAPDGNLYTPCDYCDLFGGVGQGDVCRFEGLAIASSTCECPYTLTCYAEDWAGGSSGNCFFAPGITTTEPCINGSWNGQTCTQGYNDVCASTDCVDKICKELDWFIQNYAGYTGDTNWWGYASLITDNSTYGGYDYGFIDMTPTPEEIFVSCGQTGVIAFLEPGITTSATFGSNSSERQWGRIVGLLNYWTHYSPTYTQEVFGRNGETKSIPFEKIGGTSCGWFYPMNLCCPPVPEGAFDYDCPMCGPSGFTTHSPVETSCCCAKNMIPIVFGLNGLEDFARAATGISSVGIHPYVEQGKG